MAEGPTPLVPDEGQEGPVEIVRPEETIDQPYGLAAVLVVLTLLVLGRGLMQHWPLWTLWVTAGLVGLVTYAGMASARFRLSTLALCIIAAELGLLLGMPAYDLFAGVWESAANFLSFLSRVILAGITGILAANAFDSDRYASYSIGFSFLFVFVATSLFFLALTG